MLPLWAIVLIVGILMAVMHVPYSGLVIVIALILFVVWLARGGLSRRGRW